MDRIHEEHKGHTMTCDDSRPPGVPNSAADRPTVGIPEDLTDAVLPATAGGVTVTSDASELKRELGMLSGFNSGFKLPDVVHSPPHYSFSSIECIDAIKAATEEHFCGYLQGNAIKYLWRYWYKGHAVQDLEKAKWYIDKLIEEVKNEESS
jgi:hypothetical protein